MKKISLTDALHYDCKRKLAARRQRRAEIVGEICAAVIFAAVVFTALAHL